MKGNSLKKTKKYKAKRCKLCNNIYIPTSPTQKYCGNYKNKIGCSYIKNKELNRKHHPYKNRKEYYKIWKLNNKDKLAKYWKTFKTKYPERAMLKCIKSSAKKRNLEFNLDIDDIVIPKKCPIFKVVFDNSNDYCASVDRIDSNKGYIKGNIMIICNKANRIKNNGTINEIKKVYDFLKSM